MASDEKIKKSTFREYYEALLIAVIFVNFARIFVFQAFNLLPRTSVLDNIKLPLIYCRAKQIGRRADRIGEVEHNDIEVLLA